MVIKKGLSKKIDERYSLHIAENYDKQEFQQILELNVNVHGESVRGYLNRIYLDHPKRDDIYCFYVKDNEANQIVSGLILLPLEWSFGGKILSICEMGFVGTLEEYRGKGFIRMLNEEYERLMTEKGYVMSVIRGIPYFYRKLGYEFAIPLDHRIILPLSRIPTDELKNLEVRKANLKDINFVNEKYENYYKSFFISNKFDKDSYIFKFFNDDYNDFKTSTYIIEENGKSVAYFTFGKSYDNLGYDIKTSQINHELGVKILQFIKKIHDSETNNEIDIAIREETKLAELIIELGGITYNTYGWQVKIPILKLYLEKIKPLLESRIRNSNFKDLTQNVKISNYKEIFELLFNNGTITEINIEKGYPELGLCDIQAPGPILYKLLLRDRAFDELNYIIKDAMIKHSSKGLIDVLFPKENSFPDSYY